MKMVPYEAFACHCGAGDVVLRESYKPKTRGKLYYAFPRSKPREDYFGCEFFMERGTSPSTGQFSLSFNDSKLFSSTFNTSKLFSRTFNTSNLFSEAFKKCRVLKLQALAWKDNGIGGPKVANQDAPKIISAPDIAEDNFLIGGIGFVWGLGNSGGKVDYIGGGEEKVVDVEELMTEVFVTAVVGYMPIMLMNMGYDGHRRYGKIWYDEDVYDLRSVETEFPAIVFNDNLSSNETLSCEPTISSLNNNEIDFRISFDESDDEDYTVVFDKNSFSYKIISTNDLKTDSENDNKKVNIPLFPSHEPSVSCIEDLDFFKDFENEFSAIVYNDALTSKSDFSTKPTLCPQDIDEFDLKDETSLSEYDKEEQNILYFNDLFPFNIIYPDGLKSDKGNDDNKVDMIQSSGGNENAQGSNNRLKESHDKINKVFIKKSFVMGLKVNIVAWNYFVNGMIFNLIKNLYVPFDILFDPKRYYTDGDYARMLWRPSFKYTNANIADFETRLARIYRREVHRVQVFDFGGLPDLIAKGLSTRMLMEHRDAQVLVRRHMSWREFILALRLHTAEEMQTVGFGLYWTESARRILDKGDLSAYWIEISFVGDFLGMDVCSVNVPYLLARYLRLFASGRKQGAMISGGQFVARLAEHFGLLTKERLQGLMVIVRDLLVIDMAERSSEEAPVASGGDDEDEEMPQAVPPPPWTQGERIARLEEEVHGMREALQGQREGRCALHEIFKVTDGVPETHQGEDGWCQHFHNPAAARPMIPL
ncbi:hypothetical protein Tco_0893867 [Tanacetum coccineum]|uniref:Uncharacterized protein n=1 Tax=Tanacetum coccineum TaxID=301880 RepID=A0ABQ5CAI5_9ASTR